MSATTDWLQVVLLAVNAGLIFKYLRATERIAGTNQKQVQASVDQMKVSQEQLRASWRQVAAANDQLEAQIRPAVVINVRPAPHSLELINVGTGPAIDLILSPTKRGSAGSGQTSAQEAFDDDIAYIEVGGHQATSIRTQLAGVGGSVLNGRSLQCEYKSLSGRTYWTVVDFDRASGNIVESTRFNWEPDMEQ
jgi:hypothetical protein